MAFAGGQFPAPGERSELLRHHVGVDSTTFQLDSISTSVAQAGEPEAASATLPSSVVADYAGSVAMGHPSSFISEGMVMQLASEHRPEFVRIACLLVGPYAANQLVEDTFVSINGRRISDGNPLNLARSAFVHMSRRRTYRRLEEAGPHSPHLTLDDLTRSEIAAEQLEQSVVAEAVRTLPRRQREAIVLGKLAEWPSSAIAAAMGVSTANLDQYTTQAMGYLRPVLENA